jgi:glycine dehydrogenase subunit 1
MEDSMTMNGYKNHPYIPNSSPETQQEMLTEIGLKTLDDLHGTIPEELKLKKPLDIPAPFGSEYELKKAVGKIIDKNRSTAECLNFLGAGCWQHYVPAVCDEVNSRAEFLSG